MIKWSLLAEHFQKRLTDKLDEKIPLDTERGYHVHFKDCDHLLNRPVIFSNRGFGITPMEQRIKSSWDC